MKLTALTRSRKYSARRELDALWRKEMKAPSRTCWDTGQPYSRLGCFLAYRQRTMGV